MKKEIYALMILITGFLITCHEDDQNKLRVDYDSVEHSHKFEKKKVSFQEMKELLKTYNDGSFPKSIDTFFSRENSYITELDSTDITQINHENITTYTLYVNTKDDEFYGFSNLVIKLYDGKMEEFVLHYNPTIEWQTAYDKGEYLPYSGELIITDTHGEDINLNKGEIERNNRSICYMDIYIPCYGSACPCTDGNGQNYTLAVSCNTNSGGGTGGNSGQGSGGSPGGGSNGGGTSGGGNGGPDSGQGVPDPGNGIPTNPTNSTEYLDWVRFIYDGELKNNPCTNAVYSKLKSTKTMFNVLSRFMGQAPVAHLEWKIENISGANGSTAAYSNNELIKIKISSSYVGTASKISMARTLLHEAIHAEVLLKLISVNAWPLNSGTNPNAENDFPGIWDYWVRYKNGLDEDDGIGAALHNHMADWYRGKIKQGLIEFDNKNGTTHESWQYEALSWAGLYGTTAWNNLPSNTKTAYYNYIQQQQAAGGCP